MAFAILQYFVIVMQIKLVVVVVVVVVDLLLRQKARKNRQFIAEIFPLSSEFFG